jgi:hypothetical protein
MTSGCEISLFAQRVVIDVHTHMGNFGEAASSAEAGLSDLKKWETNLVMQLSE